MTFADLAQTCDVIVIGAGPAGALASLCAARAGATTFLIERKTFPRPKVCGGCLNPAAVVLLEHLGLGEIVRQFGLPVDRLDLGLGGRTVSLALPGGVTIPRTEFDHAIVRHACDSGVTFLPETSAMLGQDVESAKEVLLTHNGEQKVVKARAVVVAAGLANSCLGDEKRFTTRVARGSRIGLGCVVDQYPSCYASGRIAMAVGLGGYVGLTQTVEGLAIAAAIDPSALKRAEGPHALIAKIIEEAGFAPVPAIATAEWSGTMPLTRKTRPLASSRVFLVGDSAGYVEPFTGQGMALALQGAVALTPFVLKAVNGWSAAIGREWSREYARTVGRRHWPAALVSQLARRPTFARAAVSLLATMPALPHAFLKVLNQPMVSRTSF